MIPNSPPPEKLTAAQMTYRGTNSVLIYPHPIIAPALVRSKPTGDFEGGVVVEGLNTKFEATTSVPKFPKPNSLVKFLAIN